MFLQINEADNVQVNLTDGHKYALNDIKQGENVIKYGFPIGHAVCDIKKGEHVHTHNLKTNLDGELSYTYEKAPVPPQKTYPEKTFWGYRRKNGEVGIRNDIWIINTVGCVNKVAKKLSELTEALYFEHPYGCSQLGGDHKVTQLILKGLVNHPNAGGVLVLGLGCENNNIDEFKTVLGETDETRVRFLNCQDVDDEISEGVKIINELKENAQKQKREQIPISELKIGLKCGGSDGYSGISANPLCGRFSDILISSGGTSVLTEVPEMFGAETLLMQRCINKKIFEKNVKLINDFKRYFKRHGQVVYENPSPGNKKGGITTLEEKSLGCVQKGGTSEVVDVLDYGDKLTKKGLNLLNGPGNDIVAVTNLTAVGAHIILFTTGRGTPIGAPVPTIKIATNKTLAEKKSSWIDFDASGVLDGKNLNEEALRLLDFVIKIANGEPSKNEINKYREIAIFKDGVTL